MGDKILARFVVVKWLRNKYDEWKTVIKMDGFEDLSFAEYLHLHKLTFVKQLIDDIEEGISRVAIEENEGRLDEFMKCMGE